MNEKLKFIVITGPTATGKTALAVELARRFGGEVVSADSRQVYRHLDIGSGKDLAEYGEVPYHLIDIVPPGGSYHLKAFCDDARRAVADICSRGRLPVICGGSALYLHAFLKNYALPGAAPESGIRAELDALSLGELQERLRGLDPGFYEKFADRDNFNRLRRAVEIRLAPGVESAPGPDMEFLAMGVLYPRCVVRERIEQRLSARLASGLIEEVQELHDRYHMSWEQLEFLGLEYRFVAEFLQGKSDLATMRRTLLDHIRQFAKRQDIFFRKMEREGVDIHWLKEGSRERAEQLTAMFVAGEPLPEPDFRLKDFANPSK